MPINAGRLGPTATPDSGGMWRLREQYQATRSNLWKKLSGTFAAPFLSISEADASGVASGSYYFQPFSIATPMLMNYEKNYYDDTSFVKVFSSPYASAATLNLLGQGFYFKKILVQRSTKDLRGMVTFSSLQSYNTTTGIAGSSGINNFGQTPGTKIMLGGAGQHGIYNTNQESCSWNDSTGAIGAGWDASSCGSFPNGLIWGTGQNQPLYNNRSGTWEQWISW